MSTELKKILLIENVNYFSCYDCSDYKLTLDYLHNAAHQSVKTKIVDYIALVADYCKDNSFRVSLSVMMELGGFDIFRCFYPHDSMLVICLEFSGIYALNGKIFDDAYLKEFDESQYISAYKKNCNKRKFLNKLISQSNKELRLPCVEPKSIAVESKSSLKIKIPVASKVGFYKNNPFLDQTDLESIWSSITLIVAIYDVYKLNSGVTDTENDDIKKYFELSKESPEGSAFPKSEARITYYFFSYLSSDVDGVTLNIQNLKPNTEYLARCCSATQFMSDLVFSRLSNFKYFKTEDNESANHISVEAKDNNFHSRIDCSGNLIITQITLDSLKSEKKIDINNVNRDSSEFVFVYAVQGSTSIIGKCVDLRTTDFHFIFVEFEPTTDGFSYKVKLLEKYTNAEIIKIESIAEKTRLHSNDYLIFFENSYIELFKLDPK